MVVSEETATTVAKPESGGVSISDRPPRPTIPTRDSAPRDLLQGYGAT